MTTIRTTAEPGKTTTTAPKSPATAQPTNRAGAALKASETQLTGSIMSEELAARAGGSAPAVTRGVAETPSGELAVQLQMQGAVMLTELKTGPLMDGVRPAAGAQVAEANAGTDFATLGLEPMTTQEAPRMISELKMALAGQTTAAPEQSPEQTKSAGLVKGDLKQALSKLDDAASAKLIDTVLGQLSESVSLPPSTLRYVNGPGKTHLEKLVKETGQFQKVLGFASSRMTSGSTLGTPGAETRQISAEGEAAAKALFQGAFPPGVEPNIEMLIQLLFAEIAKDAAKDLRMMLDEMKVTLKKKGELRELHKYQKQDEIQLRKLGAAELRELQDAGLVSKKVTEDEWMKSRSCVPGSPIIDEATGKMTGWQEGSLAQPFNIPDSMTADVFTESDDKTDDQAPPVKLDPMREVLLTPIKEQTEAPLTISEKQKQQAQQDPFKGSSPLVGGNTPPMGGNSNGAKQEAGFDLSKLSAEDKKKLQSHLVDVADEITAKPLPKIGAPADKPLPKIGHSTRQGSGEPSTAAATEPTSFEDIQARTEETQNQQDALNDLTEPAQLRLQQYMDRRTKAFEMSSNLFKKISDSIAGIIKNQI